MNAADPWSACGMSVSRPGSQGYQQRLSDQDGVAARHIVLHQHNGTSPLRPVCDDIEQRGK